MLYSIRLSFVIAMLHAATSDSRPLQSWLHSPKVLVQARTMLDLANTIRVSKLYVGQVVSGGAKAEPSKSDPSLMLPDTFTISGPAGALNITQVMIQRAVNRLVRDSHRALEGLVSVAFDFAAKADDIPVAFSKDDYWKAVTVAVFSSPPIIIPSDTPSRVESWSYLSEDDGATMVHCSALGATFQLGEEHGGALIQGLHLCEYIATTAEVYDAFAKQLDKAGSDLTIWLSTLLMLTARGQGRSFEVVALRCGSTNMLQANGTRPDLFPVADGRSQKMSCLKVCFQSHKPGSAQGDPMTLPEEVGRLFVLYLALVRSAQVKLLLQKNPDEVDFNDRRLDSHNSAVPRPDAVAATVIWGTCISTFVPPESGHNAVVKKWDGLQRAMESCLNKRLGCIGLTLPMHRQVMASISSAIHPNFSAHKLGKVNALVARSFNHGESTHTTNYMETASNDPNRNICASVSEAGLILDGSHANWAGASGWGLRPGFNSLDMSGIHSVTNVVDAWRVFRCLGPKEALALVMLGSKLDSKARPAQVTMLQESISGIRDSLNIYGCGSGKNYWSIPSTRNSDTSDAAARYSLE
jgi:hypothetical protein